MRTERGIFTHIESSVVCGWEEMWVSVSACVVVGVASAYGREEGPDELAPGQEVVLACGCVEEVPRGRCLPEEEEEEEGKEEEEEAVVGEVVLAKCLSLVVTTRLYWGQGLREESPRKRINT